MEEFKLILIGLFTVSYIASTIIQQVQIKSLREHNQRLNEIMPIFDIKKIKEVASIEKEIAEMQIKKMMLKFEVDEIFVKDFLKPHIKTFEESVAKQVSEEMAELVMFANTVISASKKENRQIIINNHLPKTKGYFDALLEVDKKDS